MKSLKTEKAEDGVKRYRNVILFKRPRDTARPRRILAAQQGTQRTQKPGLTLTHSVLCRFRELCSRVISKKDVGPLLLLLPPLSYHPAFHWRATSTGLGNKFNLFPRDARLKRIAAAARIRKFHHSSLQDCFLGTHRATAPGSKFLSFQKAQTIGQRLWPRQARLNGSKDSEEIIVPCLCCC